MSRNVGEPISNRFPVITGAGTGAGVGTGVGVGVGVGAGGGTTGAAFTRMLVVAIRRPFVPMNSRMSGFVAIDAFAAARIVNEPVVFPVPMVRGSTVMPAGTINPRTVTGLVVRERVMRMAAVAEPPWVMVRAVGALALKLVAVVLWRLRTVDVLARSDPSSAMMEIR